MEPVVVWARPTEVKATMRTVILAATTLLTVVGCAETNAAPDSPVTPGSSLAGVRTVEEREADLHLWVSNQSFKDDPVVLEISIDHTEVVAQPFEVGSQHNWVLFPIKVSPGRHVLSVVSDTGVEMRKRFTVPETGRRYALIDYWRYADEESRHINWHIQSRPLHFM